MFWRDGDSPDLKAGLARLIKDLLDEIALHTEALQIHVDRIADDILEVRIECAAGDIKRLIGSKGLHISALRRFVKLWGEVHGFSVTIPNFEAPKESRDRYDEFAHNPDWPKDRLLAVLKALVDAIAEDQVTVQCVDRGEVSHIALRYSLDEDRKVMASLVEPIAILGNAIGKKNGHTLAVHLRPRKDCEEGNL